jgi:hypothetical protein
MDFENKIIIIQQLSTWKSPMVINQPHYENWIKINDKFGSFETM